MLIAVVAVAVVLVAAAAVIVTYGSDDKPEDAAINGLKSQLSVGDYYQISQGEADFNNTTTYTVKEMNGADLTVEIGSSDGDVKIESMSMEDYYAPIYLDVGDTSGLTKSTLNTAWGIKECWVYNDSGDSGATSFDTTDWVGVDDGIVYLSKIIYNSIEGTTMVMQKLTGASVVVDGGSDTISPVQPEKPVVDGTVRTELAVGDSVVFSVTEDGRTYVESYEVIAINGAQVTYREMDEDGEDIEISSVYRIFGELMIKTDYMTYVQTEELETENFGIVTCDVYRLYDDPDEYDLFYIGKDNRVIYKSVEYDDGRIEKISALVSTTLLGPAPDGTTPVQPDVPTNSFGIELSVGDSYTILSQERGDRDETEIYTIIAINGNRLTVEERDDRGRIEVETTTADRFLRDVFILPSILQVLTPSGTGEVNGVQCSVYTYIDDDETEMLYIHAGTGLILRERSEERDGDWEQDTVAAIIIQSLSGLPL